MIAPPSIWSISGEELDITNGVLVGVLNVTPDSFSDGGEFVNPKVAIGHGLEMVEMGAGIVDVGGESTRPGARPIAEREELRRVMPVVDGLVASGVRVSIDSCKPGVARSALEGGAVIVNDVTGFEDDAMIDVAAGSDCGAVAIHMQGAPADMHIDPRYDDVVAEVEAYLLGSIDRLEQAGVDRARIAIDPGIGFGKRAQHSLTLMGSLDRLTRHGVPVMVGTSRKGFLGKVIGDESREGKDRATAVTTALAYARGARLFRVHDVPQSRDALAVAGAIVAHQ